MYDKESMVKGSIKMNVKQLKSSINMGLIIAFLGLLICFPFKDQYIVTGLLFALFSASLIGGLADSFAVKAIFGQPLKIKWPEWLGTNIIARQRQRLVNELVQMVQYELLSPQSIRLALGESKLSTILSNFLNSEAGKETVKALLSDAIQEAVKSKRIAVILLGLKRIFTQMSSQTRLSRHLVTIIHYIFEQRIDDTIAAFLVRMIKPLLNQNEVKQALNHIIQAAISKYEKDNRRRQVANQMANIDSKKLTEQIFSYAQNWLFEFISSDHPTRIKIKQRCLTFVANIEENAEYAAQVDEKCQTILTSLLSHAIKGKQLAAWIEQIEQAIETHNEEHIAYRWSQAIVDATERKLSELSLTEYEKQLQNWLINFIEGKQDYIGKLVKEKLDDYSTEELIVLVEEKAGRDLQFIRLNGAVVGGLIGAVLFLVQLALGGAQ